MIASIQIQKNIENGQVNIAAPMNNQAEKDMSIKMLSEAIVAVVNYKPSAIINPSLIGNGNGNGNGTGHIKPPPPPKLGLAN